MWSTSKIDNLIGCKMFTKFPCRENVFMKKSYDHKFKSRNWAHLRQAIKKLED